jgi:hypothetical protein
VVDLHARCSPTSRLRRYLAGMRCPAGSTLARLLSPGAGYSLLVEDGNGRVVAMANLMWDTAAPSGPDASGPEPSAPEASGPPATPPVPELALLVEDGWQQRRLGSVLARRLAAEAVAGGFARVRAVVHAGNTPMVRIMTGLGQRVHREYDGGVLTLIASLHHGTPAVAAPE